MAVKVQKLFKIKLKKDVNEFSYALVAADDYGQAEELYNTNPGRDATLSVVNITYVGPVLAEDTTPQV